MVLSFFKKNKKKAWKSIEYFDESWKDRIFQMAKYIPENSKVLDLGCGKMWVKDCLPLGCSYIPVDYVKRDEDTIVCDFNKHEFPEVSGDISFVSGCLEYIEDYNWFVKQIAIHSHKCIVSYCLLELFPDLEARAGLAWVNNLKRVELIELFERSGFKLDKEDITKTANSVFIFLKA
jgi:hypothetical protein